MTGSKIYRASGVDLDAGRVMNRHSAAMSAETWNSNPMIEVHDRSKGHFRGPKTFVMRNMPQGCEFTVGVDGSGTKPGLTSMAMTHEQGFYDVVAMTGGDHTRYGNFPALVSNLLDVSSLGEIGSDTFGCIEKLFVGLRDVCKRAGVVALGGETAQMGNFVSSDNPEAITKFNWAGFALALWHPAAFIDGTEIRPGHVIVAGRETGPRTNGYSAIRRALKYRFGPRYWQHPGAKPLIEAAAQPPVIYDPFLVKANGWLSPDFKDRIPVSGIAHITGGGIPEKFGDLIFPCGLSAQLPDLWEPPDVVRTSADLLREQAENENVEPPDDAEFYRIFGGGQGILSVMHSDLVPDYIALGATFGLENRVAGVIIEPRAEGPAIYLGSKFGGGQVLTFVP